MHRDTILAWLAVIAFVVGGAAYIAATSGTTPPPLAVSAAPFVVDLRDGELTVAAAPQRTIDSYRGYGTWVDVFDFSPPYSGLTPSLEATELQDMADAGVRTVYLQAARLDDRSPSGLEDRWLLAEWLLAAHEFDIDVVAWYLPRFGEGAADLERVQAMIDFEVLGQRFDGIGIDIEWTGNGVDNETRSTRLIELGQAIAAANPDVPLGAIVLPPVLIEVVNEDFWPGFPWEQIAPTYDVWLPMAYCHSAPMRRATAMATRTWRSRCAGCAPTSAIRTRSCTRSAASGGSMASMTQKTRPSRWPPSPNSTTSRSRLQRQRGSERRCTTGTRSTAQRGRGWPSSSGADRLRYATITDSMRVTS